MGSRATAIRSDEGPWAWSEASRALLGPDGPHLLVRGELAPFNLLIGGSKVGLRLGGQGAYALDGLFQ